MKNNIKVSVIMPSLNVGEYIDECISSVTNQTLKEIEIICIDAGSTDNTLDILKKHAKKDSRITILNSDEKFSSKLIWSLYFSLEIVKNYHRYSW